MMLYSINNGLLVYPTVEEDGQIRTKKYSELTEAQQLQDDCDVQATNIILHGLPPDMMTMQQFQVNTKFLNALPPEWSKFFTDVKLAKSLYTTNYDQLYAYLSQHKRHTNEVRINPPIHHTLVNPQQHLVSPPPFISPLMTPQSQAEFPQLDSGLAVLMFQQGEDPIECINKAMAFAVASRVTVQQVQGRQIQSYAGTGNRGIATTSKRNDAIDPQRVVQVSNLQEKGI
ncbi:hypothetical protein Tco_0183777 [Tanacetum coccineum]